MAFSEGDRALAVRGGDGWGLVPAGDGSEADDGTPGVAARAGAAWFAVAGGEVEVGERALAVRGGDGIWRVTRPGGEEDGPEEPCVGWDPLCAALPCDAKLRARYTALLSGFPDCCEQAELNGAWPLTHTGDCAWTGTAGGWTLTLRFAGADETGYWEFLLAGHDQTGRYEQAAGAYSWTPDGVYAWTRKITPECGDCFGVPGTRTLLVT